MADTDFLTEFARKPLKVRLLVLFIVLVLLGVLYWQFLYKPASDGLTAAETRSATLIRTRKTLQANTRELKTVNAEYEKLPELRARNERMLPKVEDPIAFMRHIEEKATDALLVDFSYKVNKSESVGEFRKTGFSVSVRGSYYQLTKFFNELAPSEQTEGERSDPLVSIEGLVLDKSTVLNEQVTMEAKFIAASFDLGEAEETAPAKKKPGKKAGSRGVNRIKGGSK